jgi:hypothetical protein
MWVSSRRVALVRPVKTTPLLTAEEAVEAMKKAAGSEYRAAI